MHEHQGQTGKLKKVNLESSGFPWTWVGIGAGAVAAGVVAIVLLAGGEEETTETIADPPGRP